jgi:hypothetical protein
MFSIRKVSKFSYFHLSLEFTICLMFLLKSPLSLTNIVIILEIKIFSCYYIKELLHIMYTDMLLIWGLIHDAT